MLSRGGHSVLYFATWMNSGFPSRSHPDPRCGDALELLPEDSPLLEDRHVIHAAVTQGSADIPKVHGKTMGKPWGNCGKIIGKPEMPPKSTKYVQVWDVGWVFLFSCCQRSFEETVPTATIDCYDSWFGGPNFTISAGSTHVSGRLSAKGSYSHTIGDQCNLSHVPAKVSK